MRRFSLIHPLYMAFYSKALYRDVVVHWRGSGLLYLLVLLSLSVIPGVMRLAADFSAVLASDAPSIVTQIPPMKITDGRLSVEAPQPYYIRDKKSSAPLIVIDTTGAHKTLEGTQAKVLVTGTQIMLYRAGTAPVVLELSEFGDLTLDRKTAFEALDSLEDSLPLILYPLAVVFSLGVHATFAFMLGVAGYGALRLNGGDIQFQTMLRLAAVALTPSVIAGAFLVALGGQPPFWWAAGIIISAGYMLFGLRACRVSEDLDTTDGRT